MGDRAAFKMIFSGPSYRVINRHEDLEGLRPAAWKFHGIERKELLP